MINFKYNSSTSLKGKIIVSTPAMIDNRFFKSVILITNHTKDGALGVVINKPSAHQFSHILKSVKLPSEVPTTPINIQSKISIVIGGPININNLFIIHDNSYSNKETYKFSDNFYSTNHSSVVLDLADNKGPQKSIIAIGCANWTAGQLEEELTTDSWVIADASDDLLFNTPPTEMYSKIMKKMNLKLNNYALFANSVMKS